jgi:hypothetical protein
MQRKSKYTLADAQLAAAKLFLLPSDESRFDEADWEFLRSEIAGEVLEGEWRDIFYGQQDEV